MSAPLVVTERLELSPPVREDRAAMLAIVSHSATGRFLGAGVADQAEQFQRFARNAGSWFLYGYGSFTIRRRGSSQVIGTCGMFHSWRGLGEDFDDRPEAGWIMRHDHVGRGFAREAMDATLAWFERTHGPRRIGCMVAPENIRSIRLAGQLGFVPLRDATLPDGGSVRLFSRPPGGVA